MALAASRGTRGPADLVAGSKLAAADLGRRDVDVVRLRLEPAEPQEPVPLRRDLEHPDHVLGLGVLEALALRLGLTPALRWLLRLGRLLRLGAGVAAALGDLRHELVAAKHPVPGHRELSRAGMKVGEMKFFEPLRHGGGRISARRRDQARAASIPSAEAASGQASASCRTRRASHPSSPAMASATGATESAVRS